MELSYIYERTKIGGAELGKRKGQVRISAVAFFKGTFQVVLQIYVTSNIPLNLMMSFSNFPRRDCFRQVGFDVLVI